METPTVNRSHYGTYEGVLCDAYACADLAAWLCSLKTFVDAEGVRVLAQGRHRNVLLETACQGKPIHLVVKAFGKQSAVGDALTRVRGSKAERTWLAAVHLQAAGVGTPPPVGFFERWEGGRLVESYFLAEYCPDTSSFKDELVNLFRYEPECAHFMSLMETVARAVRRMHDAGFVHRDLGNQNILLRRKSASTWGDVVFIDLNRGRRRTALSLRERGYDLSRITLPSDLMRVFREMYWAPDVPPPDFLDAERRARRRYARHCATRFIRHPLRRLRKRRTMESERYPNEKDLWIWDERSGQAIPCLKSRDRHRHYARGRNLVQVGAVLRHGFRVWWEYRKLKRTAFVQHVEMRNRVSVAISAREDRLVREVALLHELGDPPVHIRFYHHETETEWRHALTAIGRLKDLGFRVSVALVQDRRAVLDPDSWKHFVDLVLDRVGSDVEWVEIGHAINRVKWGIWGFREYDRLWQPVIAHSSSIGNVRFTGPACIDFEYPFLLAALSRMPRGLHLNALSHHLYVDRRGAPENLQTGFATMDKAFLARAVVRSFPKVCEDRLILSEVNWPLQGTGVYSPVGSPYESPGERQNDPSVSEEDYASFMVRYILTTICSGAAEQVVWWQLAAHGYGLVDDMGETWRKRPAFEMLKTFLGMVGDAVFESRMRVDGREQDGTWAEFCVFRKEDGQRICVAYTPGDPARFEAPVAFSGVLDHLGDVQPQAAGDALLMLSGQPIYLTGIDPVS